MIIMTRKHFEEEVERRINEMRERMWMERRFDELNRELYELKDKVYGRQDDSKCCGDVPVRG